MLSHRCDHRGVSRDRWAEWLAVRRFGGDAEVRRRALADLSAIRDKVLDLAGLEEGEAVLDVGCGEGMIGFGALERGAGEVVFSDVSSDLLEFCRVAAEDLGVADRCRFVQAAAEDLSGIDDASVDLVTTRSVLIYVARKREAFGEFARVLRPGGRIALFEPINRFSGWLRHERWWGYDLGELDDVAAKLRLVYETLQPPDTDPMVDFDERDLLRLAEEAGFFPIHLELEADVKRSEPRTWESFLNVAGNPNIPTLAEAMEQALTPGERERLSAQLRPQVEQGLGEWRIACAYLVGRVG
jgi:SAM-dependent methyltransferase